jgi:hypothetical protein
LLCPCFKNKYEVLSYLIDKAFKNIFYLWVFTLSIRVLFILLIPLITYDVFKDYLWTEKNKLHKHKSFFLAIFYLSCVIGEKIPSNYWIIWILFFSACRINHLQNTFYEKHKKTWKSWSRATSRPFQCFSHIYLKSCPLGLKLMILRFLYMLFYPYCYVYIHITVP